MCCTVRTIQSINNRAQQSLPPALHLHAELTVPLPLLSLKPTIQQRGESSLSIIVQHHSLVVLDATFVVMLSRGLLLCSNALTPVSHPTAVAGLFSRWCVIAYVNKRTNEHAMQKSTRWDLQKSCGGLIAFVRRTKSCWRFIMARRMSSFIQVSECCAPVHNVVE